MCGLAPLLLALLASGPSGASAATASAPAPAAAVSPLVAAARAARASAAAAPPRKVWTIEDVRALEGQRARTMNVLDLPMPGTIDTSASSGVGYRPLAGVGDRYRELLAQADAELTKLDRERLAGQNPLLRGLGGPKPRSPAEIEADAAKWRERRDAAARGLGRSTP